VTVLQINGPVMAATLPERAYSPKNSPSISRGTSEMSSGGPGGSQQGTDQGAQDPEQQLMMGCDDERQHHHPAQDYSGERFFRTVVIHKNTAERGTQNGRGCDQYQELGRLRTAETHDRLGVDHHVDDDGLDAVFVEQLRDQKPYESGIFSRVAQSAPDLSIGPADAPRRSGLRGRRLLDEDEYRHRENEKYRGSGKKGGRGSAPFYARHGHAVKMPFNEETGNHQSHDRAQITQGNAVP